MSSSPTLAHGVVATRVGPLHLVEQGRGPLVVLVHGFPETWRSWRRQLPALAAAGFRAVAIDVRGYGRSPVPDDVAAYRLVALVDDLAAVVHGLGEQSAVVVGHDVGSPIAATAALLRPDLVRAVGLLGVPYTPPGGPRPTEAFARIGGESEFYVSWFQEPGRAEADAERDPEAWLTGFYAGLTGESHTSPGPDGLFFVPRGARMSDRFPDAARPGWLSAADLSATVADFRRTGFTGALNRYRNADRDWADLAPFRGAPLTQPAIFIGGERDATTAWLADAIASQHIAVPRLHSSTVLPGSGHWVHQERPDEVNDLLISWLEGLPPA